MEHVERRSGEFDDFYRRKETALSMFVNVSLNRCCWCQLTKAVEDGWIADITRVNYVVHAGESSECFGPQKPMSIRDDADAHAGLDADGETRFGVKIIAECVAEKIKRQDAEHDSNGREDDEVG